MEAFEAFEQWLPEQCRYADTVNSKKGDRHLLCQHPSVMSDVVLVTQAYANSCVQSSLAIHGKMHIHTSIWRGVGRGAQGVKREQLTSHIASGWLANSMKLRLGKTHARGAAIGTTKASTRWKNHNKSSTGACLEDAFQESVVGSKAMMGGGTPAEEQSHGVPLIAKGGLHTNEHIAKLLAVDQQVLTLRVQLACETCQLSALTAMVS